jgi:hypothetical protein
MTRSDYLAIPALNASTIKAHYKQHAAPSFVLQNGIDLHYGVLEASPEERAEAHQHVYNAIQSSPVFAAIFNGADKEVPVVSTVEIGGLVVDGKCIPDIRNRQHGIIIDIKTTSAKDVHKFGQDMIAHNNHIQALWNCLICGIPLTNFYFWGVNGSTKKKGATAMDILMYRCTPEQYQEAEQKIIQYLTKQ